MKKLKKKKKKNQKKNFYSRAGQDGWSDEDKQTIFFWGGPYWKNYVLFRYRIKHSDLYLEANFDRLWAKIKENLRFTWILQI